ncbi:MAG: hypothetical protein WC390_06505 [Sulfurimonas sp.]|jgi:hypothetical protein
MIDKLTPFRNPKNNILKVTLDELKKLHYKKRTYQAPHKSKEDPHSEEGDLLCLSDIKQDMWAVLDKKSAKSIDPAKFLVYFR